MTTIQQIQSLLGVTPDGKWGPISQAALTKETVKDSLTVASPHDTGTLDARTESNIATLIPRAQVAARRFMAAAVAAMADHGLNVRITSGRRTYQEQAELYDQGRTKPGPKVTNSPPGYSWHNFGVAWDITLFDFAGNPIWDSPHYRELAEIGRAQGLDCGAFWATFPDEPHFQLPNLPTLASARALHDSGREVS